MFVVFFQHAERRANSNLGNSHIFLGQFELAADHYKRTLSLAMEIDERAVEAQACYSLGNTYTLLRDFPTAIDYHQRHLAIAQELGDRVGEARACWSLGNAHSAIGNHEKALYFAQLHYLLAKELGDPVGESTARMNVEDLRKILGMTEFSSDTESLPDIYQVVKNHSLAGNNSLPRHYRMRRQSMEQLDLIKLTPDGKKLSPTSEETTTVIVQQNENVNIRKSNDEDFFEFLTKSQSKRMDDQRCSLKLDDGGARKPLTQQNINMLLPRDNRNQLLEMIENLQSERMNEQRAILPGLKRSATQPVSDGQSPAPDDAFLDMLMRCQGSRLEEQRSELPKSNITMDAENDNADRVVPQRTAGATVPDEDFLSLIMKVQGGRMEDQRATVPLNVAKTNEAAAATPDGDNRRNR
jgi:G-protein signaling modulator 2